MSYSGLTTLWLFPHPQPKGASKWHAALLCGTLSRTSLTANAVTLFMLVYLFLKNGFTLCSAAWMTWTTVLSLEISQHFLGNVLRLLAAY